MTFEQVIDWKLATLTEGADSHMTAEMAEYVNQHPELQQELEFIEAFYADSAVSNKTPSASMDAGFYQMLSKAQAAVPSQMQQLNDAEQTNNTSWVEALQSWLWSPRPVAQFAALALVFAVGFNANQGPQNGGAPELASLQQQVSSLNTMLALNLMDKSSASERLSGVAYSRESDLSDPLLQQKLTDLIQNDSSTSVRLAVLNRLSQLSDLSPYTEILLALTADNNNALIQFAAVRILLNSADKDIQQKLQTLAADERLNPDIRQLISNRNAQTFA